LHIPFNTIMVENQPFGIHALKVRESLCIS